MFSKLIDSAAASAFSVALTAALALTTGMASAQSKSDKDFYKQQQQRANDNRATNNRIVNNNSQQQRYESTRPSSYRK